MSDIVERSAAEIAREVNAGNISASEITEASLARVDAVEGRTGAFLTVLPELARTIAAGVDARVRGGERLPLAGVPLAVKDNMCLTGTRTTCGSKILEHWVAPYTATAVARMLAAGCVPIGKANLDEFAMGSSCENSALGVTRNPYDLERVPGGSSGGSAAAVAARETALALGSDTGGSIREPGAFCNLIGFKPTYGRVSRYGLIAFASSLDQIGPLARTVEDAALAYEAMSGHDPMDATSIDRPVEPAVTALRDDLRGLRVGIVREFDTEKLGAELDAAYRQAYAELEKLGARVVDVSLPTADYGLATYYLIAPAECSSNLSRFDGVRYGLARRRARRPSDVRADAGRRLRSGSQAPYSHRNARAVERLLRRLLRTCPEGAHAHRPRFRKGLCGLRPHRVSGSQLRGFSVQRKKRSVQHVYDGLLHDSDVAGRITGAFGALRLGDACGRKQSDAAWIAAVRAAVRRGAVAGGRARVRTRHDARLALRSTPSR